MSSNNLRVWALVALLSVPFTAVTQPITELFSFARPTGLAMYPAGPVIAGSDGKLYGAAGRGGDRGSLFTMNGDGSGYRVIHHFTAERYDEGADPTAGLIEGKDGRLYGVALGG